jgi:hypothetical protein
MLAALAEKKKLAAFMLHNPQHSFLAFVFPAFLSSDISRRPKPQNMTGFAVFLIVSCYLPRFQSTANTCVRVRTPKQCRVNTIQPPDPQVKWERSTTQHPLVLPQATTAQGANGLQKAGQGTGVAMFS